MFQLDINNAFLHGDLDEEVYMKLPPGLSAGSVASYGQYSNFICHIQKSFYGLRQASRHWYAKLSHALCSRGYFHYLNDYSLFIRRSGGSIVLLVVYVDDIILTSDDLEEISALKLFLDNQFKIKDLGVLNSFLDIDVAYLPSGLLLHQSKFIRDLLHENNCELLSHVTCPLDLNSKLKVAMGDPLPSPDTYRSLVGKLNFLTHTRKAAMHLLRYLKGTSDVRMFYGNSPSLSLSAFCDSDCDACPDTRRSATEFCILLGIHISWKAKKQPVVSLSSAEAKYRAISKVVAELTWVVQILSDFDVDVSSVVLVFCDNQAAIHIAKNLIFHERTKHIELDCHFVRNKLSNGLISLNHVPTTS
uniref:Uncharacterized mitochondrial protein AtMg00810-like n=1 Tax=Nicotiana tabacum TaxID=4097 RepID=A0A1S3X9T3_TOBAC|nr:PREDICTED: uncharacterized mitochondrial protein AtMg00810-like [Nicotiana tabacum]